MIEPLHEGDEPTPTIRELHEMKQGYAEAVEFNKEMKPTVFRLTEKGYTYLGSIMRRNAAASIARNSQNAEARAAVRRATKGEGSGSKSAWTPA